MTIVLQRTALQSSRHLSESICVAVTFSSMYLLAAAVIFSGIDGWEALSANTLLHIFHLLHVCRYLQTYCLQYHLQLL